MFAPRYTVAQTQYKTLCCERADNCTLFVIIFVIIYVCFWFPKLICDQEICPLWWAVRAITHARTRPRTRTRTPKRPAGFRATGKWDKTNAFGKQHRCSANPLRATATTVTVDVSQKPTPPVSPFLLLAPPMPHRLPVSRSRRVYTIYTYIHIYIYVYVYEYTWMLSAMCTRSFCHRHWIMLAAAVRFSPSERRRNRKSLSSLPGVETMPARVVSGGPRLGCTTLGRPNGYRPRTTGRKTNAVYAVPCNKIQY